MFWTMNTLSIIIYLLLCSTLAEGTLFQIGHAAECKLGLGGQFTRDVSTGTGTHFTLVGADLEHMRGKQSIIYF